MNEPNPQVHANAYSPFAYCLAENEISNPSLIIDDLFSFEDLPGIRELLWLFFRTAITGSYTHELSQKERSALVTLFEKLANLVEAVHLIHVGSNEKSKPVFNVYSFFSEFIQIANLEKLVGQMGGDLIEQVKKVIEIIVQVTNAEKLFLASVGKDASGIVQYDFLILLPGSATYTFKDYQTEIESQCSHFGSLLAWCCKTTDAYRHVQEGHIFYSGICTGHLLVYDNERLPLPARSGIDIAEIKVKARNIFTKNFDLASSFLEGATYFITNRQLNAAAFLLHQAAELSLRALLLSLTAFNARGHNLQSLLRHCNFCAPELTNLFPQNIDAEKELYHLLHTAYVHTRYRNNYAISPEHILLLLERVGKLQSQTGQIF